ncbi:MAG: PAS domain-containing protein [Thermodesulfovibrionales bacterium]
MNSLLFEKADFLKEVFEAIPAMLLIVDDAIRILHLNSSASAGLGLDLNMVHKKRGGDALHCIHAAELTGGCGKAAACSDCLIRNSVAKALQGNRTYRKQTRMELLSGKTRTELHLLLTASPFNYDGTRYVVMTLENISELIQLKSLLPICMHCKKIRDDEGYWNDVSHYLQAHLDIEFSHGLCQDCLEKHYPDSGKK